MNISSFVISEIKHNICGKLDLCSICDSSAGRSYKHMDQPRIPSKSMQIIRPFTKLFAEERVLGHCTEQVVHALVLVCNQISLEVATLERNPSQSGKGLI